MSVLFPNDQEGRGTFQPGEGTSMPTSFGDTFAAAWSRNNLFTNNMTGENDRLDALGDYLGDIKKKTGVDLAPELDYGGASGMMPDSAALFRQANGKLEQLHANDPTFQYDAMTFDQLQQKAVAKRRQADADLEATMGRERGPGATIGRIAGATAAGVADPVNLAALPAAPAEGLGILANAFRWGLIGAGTQAVSEAIQAPYQEQVQPGYLASGQPLADIAAAGAFAAGGGALFRGLADTWSRVKTGAWPTSVRDAGNVVESEANISASNIYGGVEGEAAHRQALTTAIGNILADQPVNVEHIITPELEAQSRNLMARLEGERAVSLPVFDERQIRLTSEEAGLQQQHAELGAELEGLPAGDTAAADRLNRLQAIEAQLPNASPEMRRALLNRRDQILVDTTPEALQEAAAPIARRGEIGAQQGRIAQRLEEIAAERRQIDAQNLSSLPQPAIGQTEPVRAAPIAAIRTHAQEALTTAERLRANLGLTGTGQAELPFERTAAEGEAETANKALVSGVQQVSRRAGYDMPEGEADVIARKLMKLSPEDAEKMLRDLQMSPRQIVDAPMHLEALEDAAREARTPVTPVTKPTPELDQAFRADVERELVAGDKQIPIDDKMTSLDGAMNELENYKTAADQIAACTAAAPEEPAEAA